MFGEPVMTKKDNTRIVELIERAERETPFCDCGLPMAATKCKFCSSDVPVE